MLFRGQLQSDTGLQATVRNVSVGKSASISLHISVGSAPTGSGDAHMLFAMEVSAKERAPVMVYMSPSVYDLRKMHGIGVPLSCSDAESYRLPVHVAAKRAPDSNVPVPHMQVAGA